MRDGFKVIDADAHFYEPVDIWDKYLEPPYNERMPKIARVHGKAIFEYEGSKMHTSMHSKTLFSQMEAKFGHAYHDNWSLESRLKDMDEEGWDIQVCLPTNGGRGSFESDPGMAAALCRAYNNWAHDFLSNSSRRLKFTAVVPGQHIEDMVKEASARRAGAWDSVYFLAESHPGQDVASSHL